VLVATRGKKRGEGRVEKKRRARRVENVLGVTITTTGEKKRQDAAFNLI